MVAHETGDATDKPVEPEEVDMTKMRQWLRDKLLAIDFRPETDASHENFDNYLNGFSKEEKELLSQKLNKYKGDGFELFTEALIRLFPCDKEAERRTRRAMRQGCRPLPLDKGPRCADG